MQALGGRAATLTEAVRRLSPRKPAAQGATSDEGCLKPPADAFGVAPSAPGAFGASSSACTGSRRRRPTRARAGSRALKSGQVEMVGRHGVAFVHSRRSASSGRKRGKSSRCRGGYSLQQPFRGTPAHARAQRNGSAKTEFDPTRVLELCRTRGCAWHRQSIKGSERGSAKKLSVMVRGPAEHGRCPSAAARRGGTQPEFASACGVR